MTMLPKPVREKRARKPIPRSSKPIARRSRIKRGKRPNPLSKKALPKLKKKLWPKFAAYVKKRDGAQCFTCDRVCYGRNRQAGHLFNAGAHSLIRYEPKNVHTQCGRCNLGLEGNKPEYVVRFIAKYGQAEFDRLRRLAPIVKQWRNFEIIELMDALDKGGHFFEAIYAEKYGLTEGAKL